MSQTNKLIAGCVVLAALAGAAVYAGKKDATIGTSSTTSALLPAINVTDDVDKVSLTNGSKGEIVLEKKGDKWVMSKPVSAPANSSNVDQLVKNLKELKAKEVIVATASDDSKKEYEFGADKALHVVAFKGADKKFDMVFGTSGPRGQMAMVDGKPGIFAVTGYSAYLYSREAKGFRESEIYKFDEQNAVNLTIEKKDGTLSFTKDGEKWSGTFKGKPIERFDEEKVRDAIRALHALNADDFGDGKTPAETGLDDAVSKVTISLKDNAGKYSFRVGKNSTGSNRWLIKDGSDTIYSIAQYTAEWATAEASKFQKSLDAGTPTPPPAPPPHMGDPHGHP